MDILFRIQTHEQKLSIIGHTWHGSIQKGIAMKSTKLAERDITFTRREEEVLCLLAGINTNEEICTKLDIREGTLINHFKNIQRKTNIYGSRKTLLIRYAIDHGYGRKKATA